MRWGPSSARTCGCSLKISVLGLHIPALADSMSAPVCDVVALLAPRHGNALRCRRREGGVFPRVLRGPH